MVALDEGDSVKVYTVNGAASGSSSSLPDWLTRKRAAKAKGKRFLKEEVEGTIELIQHFDFPEASNRIKTTRDGHHAIATGVYKPQMRVYDLDQLTLKFERHSDTENVDFIILSDDWTKTLHLQSDRSIELHTQGGFHYRTRIPRFGRSIAYHFPSCDALVSASGPEIYRLNLNQGRFLKPLILEGDGGEDIVGVNVIDINPAHRLLAFGVEGNGTVEFWDHRSRSRVGILRLPKKSLMHGSIASASLPIVDDAQPNRTLSVTAISSRTDGLSYAIGTSTGHTLLYDIRSPKPFAIKDLGYGLPVKNVAWMEGGSRIAGDGLVLSADKKVIKIWDRNTPSSNFTSITPSADINHVHHLPGSGLIMLANEGIKMTTYYIPQLGPAPKWCSFLENITEEMEEQTVRSVYEDYKFVDRTELNKLGLDHLVGTPALKPYMHGYFLSLRLYDAARVITNPFAYAEHREKIVKEKLEKLSETRIRSKKPQNTPKVNKGIAERVVREEERRNKKKSKTDGKKAVEANAEMDIDIDGVEQEGKEIEKPNLLNDPRFKELFENPEYEIDEESREFGLLNPSVSSQRQQRKSNSNTKTAVEQEEDESDRPSSDDFLEHSESEDGSEDDDKDEGDSEDSSDAGDLGQFDPRSRPKESALSGGSRKNETPVLRRPVKMPRMVPVRPQTESENNEAGSSRLAMDGDFTFGQRRQAKSNNKSKSFTSKDFGNGEEDEHEISWIPQTSSSVANGVAASADSEDRGGRISKNKKRPGVETFAAGLERGGVNGGDSHKSLSETERHGRTQRRTATRSGSKNVFRRM